ncbi:NUDIX domain-containing protein [Candidatus Woesebacteria bacterium]|nr:MAG: NUDIX domain-containing protein [Candidatus Woesebacteria bacterium]
MRVEIEPPCPLLHFGVESVTFELSSVAVWVIVYKEGVPAYFLTVQQADKPGNPWGVPAGKVIKSDNTPQEAGVRELREETGIIVQTDDLRYLTWSWEHPDAKSGHLMYGVEIDISQLDTKEPQVLDGGTIIFEPPASVDKQEISFLALVPVELAFKPNVLNDKPYHFQETYRGLASLRRVGIISGNYGFEKDPYLFDDE